ncbi:MAG: D-alanyl-D-alanine carboxypeptidase/D-alanyl-D-alanine-endopeptidase [Cytophagales bacterium]|nr:D-alanyl-D-alanine carboxypeptidase/D-alanyl-D-alanine-endopeptidase [Cytophagales bacterium]
MVRINVTYDLRLFILLQVVCTLSSCVATRYKIEKTPLGKYFAEHPVFKESHSGLLVYDIDESEVLFDHNSQRSFTPASNTKLLTYLATVKMMKDSVPSIEYCLMDDTLFFTGTGDPTLLHRNFEYGKTIDFLSKHLGQIVYIERPMDDKRFGPGWAWDDYPYYFSAEKASFPIYGNMVRFGKEAPGDLLDVTPIHFQDYLSIVQEKSVEGHRIDRDELKNEFRLTFDGNPAKINREVPFIYSDELFVKLLSDTLKKKVLKSSHFPDCSPIALHSVPTDSVSKYILMDSDNFLAEQMLLVISGQSGDTLSSGKAIQKVLENLLSKEQAQIFWVDGSGLSRYNRITPNAMVSILKKLYVEVPKDKLFRLLPESGSSGTLKTSFPGLSGKIHAKTGSMRHVYNLSGYLETNSGKILLFSFMNNNFNVSFNEMKREMEKVLTVFVTDN